MQAVAIEKAETVLAADANVVAAWVFGSAQDGSVRPGSDLDIGVLFRSKPVLDELTDLLLGLQRALNFEGVDLVVLNGASSILRFEAISGHAIYCRDANERAEFVSLSARVRRQHGPIRAGPSLAAESYGIKPSLAPRLSGKAETAPCKPPAE